MRCSLPMVLFALAGCRPTPPSSPVDIVGETPASENTAVAADERIAAPVPEAPPVGGLPRVVGIVDELAGVVNAAFAGRDLPDTRVRLPGVRGEQVVRVQSESWPEGELTVTASLLKIDVTLDGCPPGEGLTIGVVQTASGVYLVGLGDQFHSSEPSAPEGFDEVTALAERIMGSVAAGEGADLVLDDDQCQREFGSLGRCRQMFREIPSEATIAQYRDMLSACRSEPAITLALVALWLRDEAGAEYQGLVRMTVSNGRIALTEPILIASGLE